MYSTIVTGHPTIIRHSIPQPKTIGVNSDAARAFSLSDEATKLAEKMEKGSYSVPVKFESSPPLNENDSFEIPNFFQSKESLLNNNNNNNNNSNKENDPQRFILNNFTNDANMLLNNLENKNNKSEKITSRKKIK